MVDFLARKKQTLAHGVSSHSRLRHDPTMIGGCSCQSCCPFTTRSRGKCSFTKILMRCSLEWPILNIFQTIIKYLGRFFLHSLTCSVTQGRSADWQFNYESLQLYASVKHKVNGCKLPSYGMWTPVGRGKPKISLGAQTRKVRVFSNVWGDFPFPSLWRQDFEMGWDLGSFYIFTEKWNNFCAFVKCQPKTSDETSQKLPNLPRPPYQHWSQTTSTVVLLKPPLKSSLPSHPSSHPPSAVSLGNPGLQSRPLLSCPHFWGRSFPVTNFPRKKYLTFFVVSHVSRPFHEGRQKLRPETHRWMATKTWNHPWWTRPQKATEQLVKWLFQRISMYISIIQYIYLNVPSKLLNTQPFRPWKPSPPKNWPSTPSVAKVEDIPTMAFHRDRHNWSEWLPQRWLGNSWDTASGFASVVSLGEMRISGQTDPYFWRSTHQDQAFSNHNKGHVGSRYILHTYIYI